MELNTSEKQPLVEILPVKKLEFPDFTELWEFRDLVYLLARRELKTRFQQTTIGILWIALQPITQMLIFYLILGVFVKVPTGDVPYPIFFLSGFVVWQFFSQIINYGARSLLDNIDIIVKTYFPRLALPISTVISSLVDFFVSFALLLILMLANGYPITIRFLFLPLLLVITIIFSSGVGLLFGALMVSFRDMKNLISFIMMIWMYLTPIMYPSSLIPEKYLFLFWLNPMTSLVEVYRWVFLNSTNLPPMWYFFLSCVTAIIIWLIGALYFRRMENKIADVM